MSLLGAGAGAVGAVGGGGEGPTQSLTPSCMVMGSSACLGEQRSEAPSGRNTQDLYLCFLSRLNEKTK